LSTVNLLSPLALLGSCCFLRAFGFPKALKYFRDLKHMETMEDIAMPYRFQENVLYLDEEAVPMIFPAKGAFWVKAKPVHNFLGAQNISQTMARVRAKHKLFLHELLARFKIPAKGKLQGATPISLEDANELNAIWISEPGFYKIILGSKKPIAIPFQDWVFDEVLPTIRKTGCYVHKRKRDDEDEGSEQLAQRPRYDGLQMTLTSLTTSLTTQIQTLQTAQTLTQRQVLDTLATLQTTATQSQSTLAALQTTAAESQGTLVVLETKATENQNTLATLQTAVTENGASLTTLRTMATEYQNALMHRVNLICMVLAMLPQTLQTHCNSFVQRVAQTETVMLNAFGNPAGVLINGIRAAVRRPSRRSTIDERRYPQDQLATPEDLVISVPLYMIVFQKMQEPCAMENDEVLPGVRLTNGAWRRLRNLIGKRALRYRLAAHELGLCARPRLWSNGGPRDNAGPRYVFLATEATQIVAHVLQEPFGQSTIMMHAREIIATTEPLTWPLCTTELEPQWETVHQDQENV
jgi:prophage antirepressor-like protein